MKNICIATNPIKIYKTIVADKQASDSYLLCVELEFLKNKLGAKIVEKSCALHEIIIKIENKLAFDEYKIYENEEKLYLTGGHIYSLIEAIRYFKEILLKEDSFCFEKSVVIEGKYENKGTLTDDYTLVWSDEFDKGELNRNNWDIIELIAAGTNDRKMKLSDKALSYENNQLHIKPTYDDEFYYGAEISTKYHLSYKYGYTEARMYIPEEAGFLPSFWVRGANAGDTLPHYDFLEFDFFERFGNMNPHTIKATVLEWLVDKSVTPIKTTGGELNYHTEDKHVNSRFFCAPDSYLRTVDAGWHTIGCEWTDTFIRFCCDGKVFYEMDFSEDFERVQRLMRDNEAYLLFSVYTGKKSVICNPPDETTNWNEELTVEYVHLYQKKGSKISFIK